MTPVFAAAPSSMAVGSGSSLPGRGSSPSLPIKASASRGSQQVTMAHTPPGVMSFPGSLRGRSIPSGSSSIRGTPSAPTSPTGNMSRSSSAASARAVVAPITVTGFDLTGREREVLSGWPESPPPQRSDTSSSSVVPAPLGLSRQSRKGSVGLLAQAFLASSPSGQHALSDTASVDDRAFQDPSTFQFVPSAPAMYSSEDAARLLELKAQHAVFRAPLVSAAFVAAARAHRDQVRKSGASVLSHCLETAAILAGLGLPEEVVAAGLLHDALAHGTTSAAQLAGEVPAKVVELVEKTTRIHTISQLYRDNAHTWQAEKILDMLTGMDDVGSLFIQLASRTHNMRTITALPRCKQVRMANETLDVFAVLANRLGNWPLKAELEDLAFRTLQPDDYESLTKQLAERQASTRDNLASAVDALKAALDAAGVKCEDMSGRCKNLYSLWRKMQKSGCTLAQVYDVQALRVVVPNKHDCYKVLREVHSLWPSVQGRYKDYIRDRKPNGYQSLHDTVVGEDGMPFEVQIRTHKMHYIAEYGFAAHWRYKEALGDQQPWVDKLAQLQQRLQAVQYHKLAVAKLNLVDNKVRPSGTPPRDMSLASLGLHSLPLGGAGAGGASGAMVSVAVDPFLRLERFSLPEELPAGSPGGAGSPGKAPINIILQSQRGAAMRELPQGSTVNDLLQSRWLRGHDTHGCRVRINNADVESGSRLLRMGDVVQLVQRQASPRPLLAPGQRQRQLQQQQQLLQQQLLLQRQQGQREGGGGGLDVWRLGGGGPLELPLLGGNLPRVPGGHEALRRDSRALSAAAAMS